jgi:Pathogenicity locus
LAEFQTVPSVGIKFAEDLVFLGYYSLSELKNKDGAKLTDEYELKKGYCTDPCVEDQFRLVVNFANTKDPEKTWWDFTEERKKFRAENGYPKSRPQKSWFEILG